MYSYFTCDDIAAIRTEICFEKNTSEVKKGEKQQQLYDLHLGFYVFWKKNVRKQYNYYYYEIDTTSILSKRSKKYVSDASVGAEEGGPGQQRRRVVLQQHRHRLVHGGQMDLERLVRWLLGHEDEGVVEQRRWVRG